MHDEIVSTADDAAGRACPCNPDAGRRQALKAATLVAFGAAIGLQPVRAADTGPQPGDWLVEADDASRKPLDSGSLKVNQKQLIAWPYDPVAKAPRDGVRLNRIALIRLDPAGMDAATKARSADGVLAYSAFCTHQGCDVSSWLPAEQAMLCFCHFSKFAPLTEASVVGGPAPRPLPALALKVEDGKLVVASGFNTPPGKAV